MTEQTKKPESQQDFDKRMAANRAKRLAEAMSQPTRFDGLATSGLSLREQRKKITSALADCDRGCFPGSKGAEEESECIRALGKFDAEHPEVHQQIMDESQAKFFAAHPNAKNH